mgnify:FL=1
MEAHKKPRGLHHVEIYVSNLKASTIFWSWFLDMLGYKEYQSWDEGISYICDTTYLVFVQTAPKHMDIEYHRCRTGLNHLAFWAQDRAQVESVTEKLIQKGIKILYEDTHPYAGGDDYVAVFFEDPDRIKVELVAPA